MSIEKVIQENTEAIYKLIEKIDKLYLAPLEPRDTTEDAEPDATIPVYEVTEVEHTPPPPPVEDAPVEKKKVERKRIIKPGEQLEEEVSFDTLKTDFLKLVLHSRPAAEQVLHSFGIERLTHLKPEQYALAHQKIQTALEAA